MKCILLILHFSFLVHRSKFLLALLCIGGFILHSSIANVIEVGGHLTENTTWDPVNNPYMVTENLFVNTGVTLTILPGTEVKLQGAPLTSWNDFDQSFWFPENDAKMIWVDGRVIAKGTQQDSIIFTRMQDDQDYYWGTIYLEEMSDLSIFKHCKIEYSGSTGIAVGQIANGALSCYNGRYLVNNCRIINNAAGIYGRLRSFQVEVSSCKFAYNDLNNFVFNLWGEQICMGNPESGYPVPLVANNIFDNAYHSIYTDTFYFVKNSIYNSYNSGVYLQMASGISYIFDNTFNNCQTGINGGGEANIYIKNNTFTDGADAINIDEAYVEIRDNHLQGCGIDTYFVHGKIHSNIIQNGSVIIHENVEYFNNINYSYNSLDYAFSSYRDYITNNVFVNNYPELLSDSTDSLFTNCIILRNGDLHWWPNPHGSDTFRNCIIDFPLDPPLVDGGGNIIVDSLQAQEIFVDIENGDFHLAPGSIAIDAGFDTLGYYYPFDLENNVRVWDGDGDGNAVIDIGAYEYGAPQLGKITGYITETDTGEPVDYALLKANNEPGEFTFADSSGYFEIQLPEGTYDLYAERVFYEDNVIYTVTVENEQNTEIAFNMTYEDPLVSINGNEIQNISGLNLKNSPNPFNPTTNISFSLPNESKVVLSVFNIKGQLVKNLVNTEMPKGQHSVIWNGLNERNRAVSSGVYLYKLKASNQESVKRMILLK